MAKRLTIRNVLARFWVWLIALSFLNTIIDTTDVRSSVSYNEMESITEWFIEDVMDMDNAIPEQEEDDTEKKSQRLACDWEDYFPVYNQQTYIDYKRHPFSSFDSNHLSPLMSVLTPPPDLKA